MTDAKTSQADTCTADAKFPVWFLSHGGGPCFMKNDRPGGFFKEFDKDSAIAESYRQLRTKLNTPRPKAILMVSAHWESSSDTLLVTSQEKHTSLYYDYGGFGGNDDVKYPAPGSPALAKQICELLGKAGFACKEDKKRNFDHGCFNVLAPVYPSADIPVVQLTILSNYDPEKHLAIGAALAPLRDQGVHIIGSGDATHNFDALFNPSREAASSMAKFVGELNTAMTKDPAEQRRKKVLEWTKLTGARTAHPQEDHLVPLFVIVGAAGSDAGQLIIDAWAVKGTISFASWAFGTAAASN